MCGRGGTQVPREQGETSEGAPDAKSSSGWDWPAPAIDVNHYCRSTTTISAAVVISPKRLLGGGGPIGRGDSLAENDAQPFVGALGLAC